MGSEHKKMFIVQGSTFNLFLCLKKWGHSNDIVVAHRDAPNKKGSEPNKKNNCTKLLDCGI